MFLSPIDTSVNGDVCDFDGETEFDIIVGEDCHPRKIHHASRHRGQITEALRTLPPKKERLP